MIICYRNNNGGENTENTVEALMRRLNAFGIDVVGEYENYNMNGDAQILRETDLYNMKLIFGKAEYVVILLTRGLLNDADALVELNIIHGLFVKNRITVFTLPIDIPMENLPERAKWLKLTHILDFESAADINCGTVNIAEKYWEDKAWGNLESRADFAEIADRGDDEFISRLHIIYKSLDIHDIALKALITIVMCYYMEYINGNVMGKEGNRTCIETCMDNICTGGPFSMAWLKMLNSCAKDMFIKSH